MSSTYSNSLRIELIGNGDQAGAWGTTTDNNFAYIFDTAIAGYQSVAIATTPYTLTSINGPTSTPAQNEAVYAAIRFTGATGATTVFAPAVPKTYIIWNDSGYDVTLYNTGYTTGPTIANNARVLVFSTGTAFYAVSAQTVAGVATVATGGTGVTTSTGSGSVVLSTSPTLVTPLLGTPTSGNLANCTFPTLNQNTTGNAATATNAVTATYVTNANSYILATDSTNTAQSMTAVLRVGTWQLTADGRFGMTDSGNYTFSSTQTASVSGGASATATVSVSFIRTGGSGFGRTIHGSGIGVNTITVTGSPITVTFTLNAATLGGGFYEGGMATLNRIA